MGSILLNRIFWLLTCLLSGLIWVSAAGAVDAELAGRTFWYVPKPSAVNPVEFYRESDVGRPSGYRVGTKTSFLVLDIGRGWMKLRFDGRTLGDDIAYVNVKTFRTHLFDAVRGDQFDFRQSSFFDEDPDLLKKRLEQRKAPAVETAAPGGTGSTVLPWKKHKRPKICCGPGTANDTTSNPNVPKPHFALPGRPKPGVPTRVPAEGNGQSTP